MSAQSRWPKLDATRRGNNYWSLLAIKMEARSVMQVGEENVLCDPGSEVSIRRERQKKGEDNQREGEEKNTWGWACLSAAMPRKNIYIRYCKYANDAYFLGGRSAREPRRVLPCTYRVYCSQNADTNQPQSICAQIEALTDCLFAVVPLNTCQPQCICA